MALFEFGEYLVHYGLPVKGSLGFDTEAAAILADSFHFLVIQAYNLPVFPDKGSFLPVQEGRINAFYFDFPPSQSYNKLFLTGKSTDYY